jgi:polyisoprenoid-binding protein YceI
MNHVLIAAGLLAALPAAALDTYVVDPNHTYPSFEIGHLGYSIQRGRFNKTSGKVGFDAAAKSGNADITIDASSIDTGNEKLGEALRSAKFFDVAKYPTLTFKSNKFNFEGDKVKSVEGDLTMHGVTRPAVLTASAFNCGSHPVFKRPHCGGEFTTTIKRSEFGMGYGIPEVSDGVLLRINVEATRTE